MPSPANPAESAFRLSDSGKLCAETKAGFSRLDSLTVPDIAVVLLPNSALVTARYALADSHLLPPTALIAFHTLLAVSSSSNRRRFPIASRPCDAMVVMAL